MKTAWRMRSLAWPLLIVTITAAACKESNQAIPSPGTAGTKIEVAETPASDVSPPAPMLNLLDWNHHTLDLAYDQHGRRDPRWDEPARRALAEFAVIRASPVAPEAAQLDIIRSNCVAAVEAGCDDPMLNYLHIRYVLCEQPHPARDLAERFAAISGDLEGTSYPEIRKFYAALRTAEQFKYAARYSTSTTPPEVHYHRRLASFRLQKALGDATLPVEELDDACHELFEAVSSNKAQHEEFFRRIEIPLFRNWPDSWVSWLHKGRFYITHAWQARGSGYADTVAEEGWRLFAERLDVAAESLERAWELNPHDVRIPNSMLTVELGQGRGRSRMELWFQRAMALDAYNYEACSSKLYYLQPKWHGSAEDMLDFGRECVQSGQWKGRAPLILVDAHIGIAAYIEESRREEYWRLPQVWPDIEAAYERFFELNPHENGWRHNLARYAYRCGQWEAFNRQLPLLGKINHRFFGGEEEFEKMVRTARELAGNSGQ